MFLGSAREKSITALSPELTKEWHPYKNGELVPSMFYSASGEKVWWKCSKCGYEWEAIIGNRKKGSGCPVCSNKTIVSGVNDLLTQNPELASEWNYDRNFVLPSAVAPRSSTKVWWKCKKCNNEWEASIANRSKGELCPKCAKENAAIKRRKSVAQYSLSGELLTTYNSITEASKETGLLINAISHACSGKSKTCGGFIWKYVL